jgi:hypothetical protein
VVVKTKKVMEQNIIIYFRKISCEDGNLMEMDQNYIGWTLRVYLKTIRMFNYLCALNDGQHQILLQSMKSSLTKQTRVLQFQHKPCRN